MQVPAVPVLPADMLRPVDIVNKFRPRSLAGLGQSGETDFEGSGLPGSSPGDFGGEVGGSTPGGMAYDLWGNLVPIESVGDVQEGGTYIPPSGANPTQVFTIPATVSRTASGGINTSARDAATINLVNSLARMGFSLAQMEAMQPGTVIQTGPGGTSTILRQSAPGQTPVPVTLFGGGVTAGANQGASVALIAVVLVGGLFLFSRGR